MTWRQYRQPTRPFSQQVAFEKIGLTLAELNEAGPWPENLMAWLNDNHKETIQTIKTAEKGIDHAYLNQDAEALEKVLAEYNRACMLGLTVWRKSTAIE